MTPQRRASDHIAVVGFDPSLRNWGVAKGIYHPLENRLVINYLNVIKPTISEGKAVKQNFKDMEAGQQLTAAAWEAMQDTQAIFAEVPHGSQSSRAMVSYGVCVGVLGALQTSGIAFYPVSESDVKKATTGNREAKKEETIAWMMERHPEAPWPMQTQHGKQTVIASKAEHMADAIGAIYAGIASKTFQQLLLFITPKT